MQNIYKSLFVLMFVTALLITTKVHAVTFSPQAVQSVAKVSAGAVANTTYAGMTAANQAVYAVRPVTIAKASVAAAVKSKAKTPWGLVIVAAVTAAGMLIDSNGDIINQTTASSDGQVGSYYIAANFSREGVGSTPIEAMQNWCIDIGGCTTFTVHDENLFSLAGSGFNWNWATATAKNDDCPAGWSSYNGVCHFAPPVEETYATDQELYDLAKTLNYPEWHKLFEDAYGRPNIQDMPEFQPVADDITTDYAAANDADPLTEPTVDPATGDTGADTSTEPPKEEDPCIANPALLSCAELDDVPDPTDIQEMDVPYSYTPFSLNSNNSCPAPMSLPKGLTMSWQPACDFATGIKPIILLVFSLIGLYIISGTKATD